MSRLQLFVGHLSDTRLHVEGFVLVFVLCVLLWFALQPVEDAID